MNAVSELADSKAGRLRQACLDLLREHQRNGDIPTNGRFVFYELEQRGVVLKKRDGINPKSGKPYQRTPAQDISDALMALRENGLIPWEWITDESRTLHQPHYAVTVLDYLRDAISQADINVWGDEEPPLILCEARATAGVLTNLAYEYVTPIAATGGQCGGFLVNEIVPLLLGDRHVVYIGDHEKRGPAEQIEANTKRVIEQHTGRRFGPGEWTKIALTAEQVNRSARLRRLAITKSDKRYKPARRYKAVECEAIGQGVLVRLIRRHLDSMLRKRGLPPIDKVKNELARQQSEMQVALDRLRRRRRHGDHGHDRPRIHD